MKKNNDPIFAGFNPLIPDGDYEVVVVGHDKASFYDHNKLYLKVKVITGSYSGTELFMPFNQADKIRPSSKYYREWVKANNGIAPAKNDRMSARVFKGKALLVTTRTVDTNNKQAKFSGNSYSIVKEIKEVLTGKP